VPAAHAWTGDPARPAFEVPPQLGTYVEGTTTAVRVRRGGTVRVFTRRYRTVLFVLEMVFGGTLSIGPTSEAWAGDPAGIRISTAAVALAFAVAGWRTLALGITVRPGRVTVRNFWATRRIRASDVLRFEPPRGAIRGGIRVVKKNGRFISASAFGTMNSFEPGDRGVRETGELNAWLASTQGSFPGPVLPVRRPGSGSTLPWRAWLVVVWALAILATAGAVANIISPPN
jgi:hypothetical protein